MLPTEAFAEVIAFLGLFILNALALTNAFCTSLAVAASSSIRWERFPGLEISIRSREIRIIRHYHSPSDHDYSYPLLETILTFPSEKDTIEFVVAAFPNCIFENLILWHVSKELRDALGHVADVVVVKETLHLPQRMSHDESIGLVRKFRKTKVSFSSAGLLRAFNCVFEANDLIRFSSDTATRGEVSADKAKEIATFYHGSGIREFRYYRSIND